eukprot:CAMPEP_0181433836 /NCGR_PEP_ID=MMETSP1110-20121109/19506_1 /TAXON_ID=174948 /ORGANISM="Symbiodinium sp., Strain CCMP421" /LENGTH=481 /DNA_ID=CAMNT_0023557319 /DNA_START=119 /DNA_END=1562 /DNA_ORIENTATION=-
MTLARGWTPDECTKSTSSSMFQVRSSISISKASPTCAPLKNEGTYFTVETCVGTPPQCFDTVADTGSDNVIVSSCVCNELAGTGCGLHDKCFRGTSKSSTFLISEQPIIESITFGSGTVDTAVATDVVSVGSATANMSEGVLLLLNRAELDVSADFQGILGLGVPKRSAAAYTSSAVVMEQTSGGSDEVSRALSSGTCMLFPQLCKEGARHSRALGATEEAPSELFLEAAQIQRFSMCFQDSAQPGALRLQVPPFREPIPQIGQLHWGVSFMGLSVGLRGGSAGSALFCGPGSMAEGMQSPCGIIPDSGTTLITGPPHQVSMLQAELCKEWPRCNRLSGGPSSAKFEDLLLRCSTWISEGGLDEIPSIFFQVGAGDGKVKTFELTSWAWVTLEIIDGQSFCSPGFGSMDYYTGENGPVWIFGMPLFFEYTVGFDLNANEVSFEKSACNPCEDNNASTFVTLPQALGDNRGGGKVNVWFGLW